MHVCWHFWAHFVFSMSSMSLFVKIGLVKFWMIKFRNCLLRLWKNRQPKKGIKWKLTLTKHSLNSFWFHCLESKSTWFQNIWFHAILMEWDYELPSLIHVLQMNTLFESIVLLGILNLRNGNYYNSFCTPTCLHLSPQTAATQQWQRKVIIHFPSCLSSWVSNKCYLIR